MHPKAIFTGLLIHTAVFLFPQVPPELKESLGQPGWNARFFQYLQELESYSEVQSFLGELIKADTLRKEKMPIRLFYYLMGEEAYRTGDWNLARHYWEFGSRESDLPSLFYRRLADLEIREGYFEDALSWIYLLEASADPEFKELGAAYHGLVLWLKEENQQAGFLMDQFIASRPEQVPGPFFLTIRQMIAEGSSREFQGLARLLDRNFTQSPYLEGLAYRPVVRTFNSSDSTSRGQTNEDTLPENTNRLIPEELVSYQIAAYTNEDLAREKAEEWAQRGYPVRLGAKMVANRRYIVIYINTSPREWQSSYAEILGGFPLRTPLIEIPLVRSE
jgi:hypothetical protein